MLRMAILSTALVGCAYRPGSFTYGQGLEADFPGQRATVGCVDVAVARRADHDSSAVLQYRFGNRCDRAVQIDLRLVAVVGRLGDGREVELWPYDPDHEIQPALLDGLFVGREALAYPTPGPATQVCADVSRIAADAASASASAPQWLCLAAASAAPEEPASRPEEAPATPEDAPAAPEEAPAAPDAPATSEEVS